MLRNDFVFSNWIFIWFILYILNILKYNPSFILLIGFTSVIIEIIYLLYRKATTYNIVKFTIINIFLKNLPIIILWYFNKLTIDMYDIYFTLFIFMIYNMYLLFNNTNIFTVYDDLISSYLYSNRKKTLWSKTYDYIYNKISKDFLV